ncbi:MAG TPA: zinc ribbon domain-containing protein [Gemmatimonadaceae bacterium]|jgi:hypothetical protein|nr:zinc ribbon domain-containing protein [Gemmatimonadaceae bacterium]
MDEIDRIFRLLVETIRSQEPELLSRPFEVADLYQSLLPYRLHRRELELETNSDYEMALLRLLSGERGYLVGDDEMQEALRRELTTPNPDPGAFRAYAMSHVSLAADAVRRLEQGTVRSAAPAPSAVPSRAAQPSGAPMSPRPTSPPAAAAPVIAPMRSPVSSPSHQSNMAAPTRSTTAEALGGRCRYCSGALPQGRRLTFCPHCGQNLTVQHCPACNTELEVGWKFCTTCGRGVQPPD